MSALWSGSAGFWLGTAGLASSFTGLSGGGGLSPTTGAPVSPPVNTVAPVASGTVRIGNVLSCTTGTWTNTPTGFTYQWRRDGVNIASATSSTYTVVAADIGPAIDCVVTASNAGGSGTPVDSNDLTYNIQTALFGASEPGYIIDISQANTCFTDTAGTTQAVVGNTVARVNDVSGRGIIFDQASGTARPQLQQDGNGRRYLLFDGGSDFLQSTTAVAFSGADTMTVCAGIRKLVDSGTLRIVVESGPTSGTTNGSFSLQASGSSGTTNRFATQSRGTTSQSAMDTSAGSAAPITAVSTAVLKIASTPSVVIRTNGVQQGSNTTSQGTGNYTDQTQFIGARNGAANFFDGWIYSLVVRRATTSGNDLTELERWTAYRNGVSL